MPALAALAVLGMAQAAPTPSPLFDAFKAACFDVGNFDGVTAAATGAGWTEVAEAQADPRIVTILGKARAAMQKEAPDARVSSAIFGRTAEGRQVWLLTSRVAAKQGWWANGCRAYDLDAPAAPARETLDGWVGTAPTSVQASGNAAKRVWAAWKPGVSLEITYVPRDNPLGATYGIQGLVLVSQSTGGI